MEEDKKNDIEKKRTIKGYKAKDYQISFSLNPDELDVSISRINSSSNREKMKELFEQYYKEQNPELSEEDVKSRVEEVKSRIDEIGETVSDFSKERKKVQEEKDRLRERKKEIKSKLKEDLSEEEKQELNKELEEVESEIKAKVKEQTKLTISIKKQYKELANLASELFKTEAVVSTAEMDIEPVKVKTEKDEKEDMAKDDTDKADKDNNNDEKNAPEAGTTNVDKQETESGKNHDEENGKIQSEKIEVLRFVPDKDKRAVELAAELYEKLLTKYNISITPQDYGKDFTQEKKTLEDGKEVYILYANSKEVLDKYGIDLSKKNPKPESRNEETPKPSVTPVPIPITGEDRAAEVENPEEKSRSDGDIERLINDLKQESIQEQPNESKLAKLRDTLRSLITEGKVSNKLLLLFGATTLVGLSLGSSILGFLGLGGLGITGISKVVNKYKDKIKEKFGRRSANEPNNSEKDRERDDDEESLEQQINVNTRGMQAPNRVNSDSRSTKTDRDGR